jgi:hypothetical protein
MLTSNLFNNLSNKNEYETKIKDLEAKNQELLKEVEFSKRLVVELRSVSHENQNHYSQIEQMRNELQKTKSENDALKMSNANYALQVILHRNGSVFFYFCLNNVC